MATVTELQLFAVDLPFKAAFRHAAAARTTSESLFLRARLDGGVEGWGESLPRAYVSGERRETAFALLRDVILPALLGRAFGSLAEVISFLEKCDGKAPPEWVRPDVPQSSAWCGVDLALLDAFGRASSEPAWLGGAGDQRPAAAALARYRYSGVVSAGRGWPYAVSLLKMRAFGFPQVKLKLERDGALQAARVARRLLGRRVDLRVDANMAWGVEQALEVIGELRTVGIQSFEQPIPADDLAGLARLVAESSAGIVADEGLTDRDSLQTLIRRRACTGANVRISKCGGLVGAHARCREALDAGLVLQVGCQVGESSLLSAAHVTLLSALAPLTPGVRYAEGCFGRHLLREDPVSPSVQFRYGGRPPRHPPGAGLGVQVDQAILQRWAVDEARIS
ncbi:MAG TPA: enolase C-terminal domain-like protein [Actinomycetes bacterium]|jgi:muconate cycloisomerase|nr:enolase C-terminal domain-like protein [Actinomycetes bacterium]